MRNNLDETPGTDEVHKHRWGTETTLVTNSRGISGIQEEFEIEAGTGAASGNRPRGNLEISGNHGLEIH